MQRDDDKRLLLHSDEDIAQELVQLRSEMTALKLSNMNLNISVATLETKVSILEGEKAVLKNETKILQSTLENIVKGSGAVYIRWGRNTCPTTAEIVYKGYLGGKIYTDSGSGNNDLCLPSDPSWSNYNDGVEDARAYIYGTEIHTTDAQHIFEYGVHEEDMPCAVCRSEKSSAMMIPARSHCYPGWVLEYGGYLMAGGHGHAGSQNHICMDAKPEFVPGGAAGAYENILYLTESRCGSLPCPPYVNGRELACVVCSK